MRLLSIFLIGLILLSSYFVLSEPTGPTIISNSTESPNPASAADLATAGGSFTTVLLNVTQQTPRWKAYVGNVTGTFTLNDANNATIYDWDISTVAGEVYVSRSNSISWSQIRCINNTEVISEQNFHNMTASQDDNLNNTFNNTVHQEFYVGSEYITNSSCRAISTYVNSTSQTPGEDADFQEILLSDSTSVVFSTILEQDGQGYNVGNYDFQIIVPESEIKPAPTTYYFYVELS